MQKMPCKGLSGDFYQISSVKVTVPGELRQLLMSLNLNLDNDTKRRTLHSITQCINLKESEANSCTTDDIKLVASFLDDRDQDTKTEALNALKAFTVIWRLKIKIQEYVPKIIEMVTANWGNDLQIAGVRLLNGLHIPDYAHSVLRMHLSSFMDILLAANTEAKVQVLKLLSKLSEKDDLLYDIMNCRAPPEFLNLFQPSQPGNLLYEMLVFVEHLSDGMLSPQYQALQWQYNESSLHEIIFGDNSRLSERLLALLVHPEEGVQTQACRVILSLRLSKEETKSSNEFSLGSDSSGVYPLESTRISQVTDESFNPLLSSSFTTGTEPSSESAGGENDQSFHPLQSTNATSLSVESTNHSFHPLQEVSDESSVPVLEESRGSFHSPPVAGSDDSDDTF